MTLDGTVQITAQWDTEFGKREPGTNAIFLMARDQCLGYVTRNDRGGYMACVGAGMGAPWVFAGPNLSQCKQAVEDCYAKP